MDIVLVNPQSDTMPPNSTAPPSLRPTDNNSRRPSLPASGQSRGSLAKINSMLIEAPITQVVNILKDIIEELKSENGDRLALSGRLESALSIIQCSELYTPHFQSFSQSSALANNRAAQDLVEGLMRPSQPSHRRSSAGENILSTSRPPALSDRYNINAGVPPVVSRCLEGSQAWDGNILQLETVSEFTPLRFLGMKVFREFDVPRQLQIDEITLERWLVLIEQNYLATNPYHNSTHAADVLSATAYFLRTERCKNLLSEFDMVASLIAAIIHDVDHPGRTNAFLCNSRHELALLYNDTAVLENHHVAKTFKLTLDPMNDANIFSRLNHEDYQTIRSNIIDMVLATELGKHFEHVNKFISSTRSNVDEPDRSPRTSQISISASENDDQELRTLAKRVLIKVSDVSNPARPRKQCIEWTRRVCEEYFTQTQEETERNLPIVMPTFKREVCSIPKTQTAFINYFLLDMFDAWHEFCDVPRVLNHLKNNLQFWDEMDRLELTTIEQIHEHAHLDTTEEGGTIDE